MIGEQTQERMSNFYRSFYPTFARMELDGRDQVKVYFTDWKSPVELSVSGTLRAMRTFRERAQDYLRA